MSKGQTADTKPSKIFIETFRFAGWILSKSYWRVKYHNLEKIPPVSDSGLIIAANHQTYLDPFWICLPIKRELRFMAWDEAFDLLIAGHILRKLGAFPTTLKRGGTPKALKQSLEILKNKGTLFIFPEGNREFSDGNLLEFKTGAVRLALASGVSILPVTIRGGNKLWSRDHKFPRPGKVEIFYHPLINFPDGIAKKDINRSVNDLTAKLKNIISSKL